MERSSIWGATIAQVSCSQFVLVASPPTFQSQQSLRSLQRQTYKSIPNLMWNPHQTIWSRANHRFLIRIIGLACWNCSSVPRLRQLAGICISLGTIRKSTSAELDEGGVLILPKCQVSKGCAMRGHNPIRFWPSVGERVTSRPRLCAVFPLWHVGDCYGTCHGLGQDDFYWNDDHGQNSLAKLFDRSQ